MSTAAPKKSTDKAAAFLRQTGRKTLTPKQARRVRQTANGERTDEPEGGEQQ